jgi:CheY-like chemotaxis protein
VVSVPDGHEGIESLKNNPETPCAIILDMMMPRVNGWEFLDMLRGDSRLAQVPVIICSAYPETAKAVKTHAIVEKPIQLGKLKNAVKALCA